MENNINDFQLNFSLRYLNDNVLSANWNLKGDCHLDFTCSKILRSFNFFNHNRENTTIREFMKKFFIGYDNDNYETSEMYRVTNNDYPEISHFLERIKNDFPVDENEAEKWRKTDPVSIACLLYTKTLQADESGYFFADQVPYTTDDFYEHCFRIEILEEMNFLIKNSKQEKIVRNGKEFIYFIADKKNIGIVVKEKKREIEKYRLETISKLLNLDINNRNYKYETYL